MPKRFVDLDHKNAELKVRIRELEEQIQDYENLKQSFGERLRFERLLSELSTLFINLPADEIDCMVEKALKDIVKYLGVDRGHLWQFSKDRKVAHFTHSWKRDEVVGVPKDLELDNFPWVAEHLKRGEIALFSRLDDLPKEASVDRQIFAKFGTKSHISVPLLIENKILGAITFGSEINRVWPHELVDQLVTVSQILANALMRKRAEDDLQKAFSQIKQLKEELERENIYLREEMDYKYNVGDFIGHSDAIEQTLALVKQVANTNSTVLLTGETGTGKGLLARRIHNLSPRKGKVMVTVNCAALPSSLIENELFGREKGAYTGALTKQVGRFEIANGSTIFLDEISELSLEVQAKLLRVLEEGQFERLGSSKTIFVDVRIIASTNYDLSQALRDGNFREDLFYRLNVFPILVPPLRERREDIPALVWKFVKEFEGPIGKRFERIPNEIIDNLKRYSWPGNVRELKNVIERSMILGDSPTLIVEIPESVEWGKYGSMALEDVERRHILEILRRTRWRIRGKNGAAQILGVKPTTLDSRIKRLGIDRKPVASNIS